MLHWFKEYSAVCSQLEHVDRTVTARV